MEPDNGTRWARLMFRRHAWPRRFWTWLAVFACSRLNAPLWDDQCTFVVTQNGPTRSQTHGGSDD